MKYVSLHHHSTYSYMDGYGLPEEHVARVADLGMSALALTEHGNTSSHIKLEQAALKHGIKPIFGLEAYTAPGDMRETKNQRKWHQTILAMDQKGYRNLARMVTRSWSEGFYRWPTVTGGIFRDHHEGLIVTSGCADSLVSCSLLGGKGIERGSARDAIAAIKRFKALLGDRYYLEVQRFPGLERTCRINAWLEEQARRLGVPLVATADCHYPQPEQNEMQKILHAAGRNIGTVAAAEASWEYDILLTPPMSDREVYDDLRGTGLSKKGAEEAIANTAVIAERCNVTLPKMERVRYPIEQEPDYKPGMSNLDTIRRWLNRGWQYRGLDRLRGARRREYIDRVEYELGLMVDKGFIDYFLMISDAVRATKDAGIPVGPARGSAAASLVCYLLRITEVNPMDYPFMLFERFIDPNRFDLPDVDLDFDDELRDFVRQHLIKRYGEECVGNIGTFTRYRGKNAIDDVARVYSIPAYDVNRAKEFLVERSGGDSRFDASIEDTVEQFPVVKDIFDKHPRLYQSVKLEGNLKGMGVHAAGLVVGSGPLNDVLSTYSREVKGKILSVMSADKYDGEHIGLMKIDALSLKTLGMIRLALAEIDMDLQSLYDIPMDDPKTIEAFRIADVIGIFQFEGRTTRMVCQEVAPTTFQELADINALSRPGPLHSGSTGDYIAVKHGRMEPEHLHPIADALTGYTHYQIIYQEQILALCRNMGKFPWVHAAEIRKVISQKKGEAAFNKLYGMFQEGAQSQGIDSAIADRTWKKLVTAGTYAFNVAHCISYSMLAFWCMWLKQHHPVAFYTAQLRKTPIDMKKRAHIALMRDARDERFGRDIQVRPPDPKFSGASWKTSDDGTAVEAGLEQIKGIGEKTAQAMVAYREELSRAALQRTGVVQISEWTDYLPVKGIGVGTLRKIQDFCAAPDPFELDFHKIGKEKVLEAVRQWRRQGLFLPTPTTAADDIPYEDKKSEHVLLGTVRARNLQDLFENHRSRTGEELDPATVRDPHLKDSMTLYMEDASGLMTVKVSRWLYPALKDRLWAIKLDYDFVLFRAVKKPYFGKTVHVASPTQFWVIDVFENDIDDTE